jgi:hypothetical protein
MRDLNSLDRNLEANPMEWTGRIGFDLADDQRWPTRTVEIVFRIDHLSVWVGNRTLAVIDRDTFREWLTDPEEPFFVDDVMWVISDTGAYLTIDDSIAHPIPGALVQHLVQVV